MRRIQKLFANHKKTLARKKRLKRWQIHLMRYSNFRKNKASKKENRIYRRAKFFPKNKIIKSAAPLSPTIRHLFSCSQLLGISKLTKITGDQSIIIPDIFSLTNDVESTKSTFSFIVKLFYALYNDHCHTILLDYSKCEHIDLDAQVLMDVVLKEMFNHNNKKKSMGIRVYLKILRPINYEKEHIEKILFSIGSFKIHNNLERKYQDILPFHLKVGKKAGFIGGAKEQSSQKEVHTTELIDYVIDSLRLMHREIRPESRSHLCQVVGEVLINAEEHGTTDKWYSIGFFYDNQDEKNHFGTFNLVIFNIGSTIYEKFKDPACPTKHIVIRMDELSGKYTKNGFFKKAVFVEETLWTLYALQEGVTTKVNYKKRGNGCIRFINSFLELKGIGQFKDDISKMTILSGNTKITFDGSYALTDKAKGDSKFRVMTFNKSGDIENQPDENFVSFTENYFPGTMIIAKIRIGEEDLQPSKS